MPRRKRGFSFLRKALKYSNGAPPAGPIANFDAFLKGTRTRNAGVIPPAARIKKTASLVPFGVVATAPPAAEEYERVTITEWSNAWRTGKLSDADVGYAAGLLAAHKNDANFYPAQVIVSAGGTATGADRNSGITALPYKNYARSSYTIPFGQHESLAPRKAERTQFNELVAALRGNAANAVKGATHVPEEYNAATPEYDYI